MRLSIAESSAQPVGARVPRARSRIVCTTLLNFAIVLLCLAGCQTQPQPPPPAPAPEPVYGKPIVHEHTNPPVSQPRKRTPEQIQMLQDFAMKESPKIWQTIQSMRAEMTTSGAKLKSLREELQLFNRNPDADEDYKSLVAGLKELRRAYDAIFDKLEDAYIAAKKYEASPSRKDYQQMMKRALEDGIQDANNVTERYRAMIRQK